jgi:opacity protein-like surface antigen
MTKFILAVAALAALASAPVAAATVHVPVLAQNYDRGTHVAQNYDRGSHVAQNYDRGTHVAQNYDRGTGRGTGGVA